MVQVSKEICKGGVELMPFTPDPNKMNNINKLTKLLKDNSWEYDIVLVTDHAVLLNVEVMPKDYVEASVDLSEESITEDELHKRYKEEIE